MLSEEKFRAFQDKMVAEGMSDAAILAFKNAYLALIAGDSGMIDEKDIKPVRDLPSFEKDVQSRTKVEASLLNETVMLKLNGGLGTSMGLDKAKSLLTVKDGQTFLDLIAQQVMKTREQYDTNVRFMLMNSFNTSKDTLDFLSKYPELRNDPQLELIQNKVPKVDAETKDPIEWSTNSKLEWCPPGHGDLYAALYGSGKLDELLEAGIKYMFVSNSDNLGATLDLKLLTWFAQSDRPFVMEVCERTAADKKGGHLAIRSSDNHFILRESAQCAKEDEDQFQDVGKHKFFNTNNLWIRLDKLKEELERTGGIIPLPMIKNSKTVDPQDPSSPAVFQLETAMGAAIECFRGAGAVVVPRNRFAPVKKCNDLFLLRSDAYILTEEATLELHPDRNGVAPLVDLDSKAYKLVQQLENATPNGIPSLLLCNSVSVKGNVLFDANIKLKGDVVVLNAEEGFARMETATYDNEEVDVTQNKVISACFECAVM
mmetsp:Transcript_29532/g.38189  ORF Transcript_29532/g.38189 Transcript_29532/m.38189 type:complete len:485 (+) Transcript_29532:71-1525(+)